MKRLFRTITQKPPLKAGFVIAALLLISFLGTPLALLARGEEPPPDEIAAADGESERVIVRLNLPVQPEGQMSAQAVRGQRMEIAAAQANLLEQFAALGVETTAQLKTLPYIGLEASPAAIERLRESPLVANVMPDERMRVALESSTDLIEADIAHIRGYTGAGQTVVVLDTGVESSHSFLAGRVVLEACFSENLCPNGQFSQIGPGAASPAVCSGDYY